jgi:hypothetical protein
VVLQQPNDRPLAQAAFSTACLQPLLGKSVTKPDPSNKCHPPPDSSEVAPSSMGAPGTPKDEHACAPTPDEKISAAMTAASLRALLPLDARAAWASPVCVAGNQEPAGVKCTASLLAQLQV